MTPIKSTNLKAVGYNPITQNLLIQFNSGKLYKYGGVPESSYNGLMAASSRGSFFSTVIRDAYSFEEIGVNEVDFLMNEGKTAPKPRKKVSSRKHQQMISWPGVFAFF